MSYSILSTQRFSKELKRLIKKFPSLKNEFSALIDKLNTNPESGTFISNNCYKIRLSILSKGKGKRGGARVITHVYLKAKTIYLLTIYDKSEKSDLKPNELVQIIESLDLS